MPKPCPGAFLRGERKGPLAIYLICDFCLSVWPGSSHIVVVQHGKCVQASCRAVDQECTQLQTRSHRKNQSISRLGDGKLCPFFFHIYPSPWPSARARRHDVTPARIFEGLYHHTFSYQTNSYPPLLRLPPRLEKSIVSAEKRPLHLVSGFRPLYGPWGVAFLIYRDKKSWDVACVRLSPAMRYSGDTEGRNTWLF